MVQLLRDMKTEQMLFHTDKLLQQDMHPLVKSYVVRHLFSLFYTSEIMGYGKCSISSGKRVAYDRFFTPYRTGNCRERWKLLD